MDDIFDRNLLDKLSSKVAELQEENERLKKFARFIIRAECWSILEQDGGTIQEVAIELGLIKPHIATEEDVDPEFDDFEIGDTIYKFSEVLKGE